MPSLINHSIVNNEMYYIGFIALDAPIARNTFGSKLLNFRYFSNLIFLLSQKPVLMGKGSLGKAFLKIMKRMLTALATSCSQAFRSSGYWALCAKPCSRTMMIEIHFHAEYTCYLLWAHWDLSSNSWLVWFVGSFEILLAMAKFRSVSQ